MSGCVAHSTQSPLLHQAKHVLEGLVPIDREEPPLGSIRPEKAYQLAMNACEQARKKLLLWEDPTLALHNAYFFTEKHKTETLLRGVLVDSESGETMLIETDFGLGDLRHLR